MTGQRKRQKNRSVSFLEEGDLDGSSVIGGESVVCSRAKEKGNRAKRLTCSVNFQNRPASSTNQTSSSQHRSKAFQTASLSLITNPSSTSSPAAAEEEEANVASFAPPPDADPISNARSISTTASLSRSWK